MLRQLATFAVRRKKTMVLGIWLPLVIIISIASGAIGDGFRTEMELPASDARDAQEMISKVSPSDGGESSQIVFKSASTVDDPAVKAAIATALKEVATIPRLRVLSPYDVPNQVNPSSSVKEAVALQSPKTPSFLSKISTSSVRGLILLNPMRCPTQIFLEPSITML